MKILTYIMLFNFSLGACIPKCDFIQLTKFKDLIEHYDLHQEEARLQGKDFTVTEFFYLHFVICDDHEHGADNDHDNLPLKDLSKAVAFIFVGNDFSIGAERLDFPLLNSTVPSAFNRDFILSVFHPPTC